MVSESRQLRPLVFRSEVWEFPLALIDQEGR